MSTQTIAPGTYRLRADVANPKPDRRAHQRRLESWHQWAIWPAGTIFIAEPHPEHRDRVRVYARGGYSSHAFESALSWHAEAYAALAAAMEPIGEAPSDYVRRTASYGPGTVALEILDRCGISLAEVQRIMAEIEADEQEGGPR